MLKKILLITYYWPPSSGSGVQRWMYFCKYLPEFGIEPIVLTVDPRYASYRVVDKSFVDHVKHIETYTTKTLEPLKLYSFLTSGDKTKGIFVGAMPSKKGLFKKIASAIRGNFFIPDARVGWNRFALKKAEQIIKEKNIDLIVTNGPPHSTHLIGLELQKKMKVKWLSDFRDPWSDTYYNASFYRFKIANNRDKALEKKVLEKADKVLTIGNRLKKLLMSKIDNPQTENFFYIHNGYDSELIKSITPSKHSFFRISFIGMLSWRQPYKSIIQSIQNLYEVKKDNNIQLCLAGNIEKEILEEIRKKLSFITVDYKGYVSHKESIKIMKEAQVLVNPLSIMKHSEILVSGKLMEYIASGNPILCIGSKDGEAAELLKEVKNSVVLEKDETSEASDFLIQIYNQWKMDKLPLATYTESIKSKSRYETTKQLAVILNNMLLK